MYQDSNVKQNVGCYARFCKSIKSQQTLRVYSDALHYYIQDTVGYDNTNHNQMIQDVSGGDPAKIRELEDNLIEYISYLHKEKQYSFATIHTRLAAIFHFYTINRVNLNKTYVSKFMPQRKKVMKDSAYTRQQIQQILSICNVRQKVIILLMTSTGMRVGAIHSLKLSHLQRRDISKQHLYKITVYDMEEEEYYTFCSFECAQAIDEYLEYRKRFGEILSQTAPLIREEFDRNDLGEVRKPKHLALNSIIGQVDDIIIQSGVKTVITKKEGQPFKDTMHEVKRSHGFRKFAITQMKLAKMDWGDREYLVGHRHSRGLDESYDRTDESDRLQEYLKAIDYLTINEENRLRRELTERKAENMDIRIEINKIKKLLGVPPTG